ncbi:MAG: hypothetical protein GTO18_20340 [Anaerolineales bacterium]|nr:hypothetical protein [Anaerolineales bacterium]
MDCLIFLVILSIILFIGIKRLYSYWTSEGISNARKSVHHHLGPGEVIREIAIGYRKEFSIWKLLGIPENVGTIIVLTNKHVLLTDIESKVLSRYKFIDVEYLPLMDVKGLEFQSGLLSGTLVIHHTTGSLRFGFINSEHARLAIRMAAMHPMEKLGES